MTALTHFLCDAANDIAREALVHIKENSTQTFVSSLLSAGVLLGTKYYQVEVLNISQIPAGHLACMGVISTVSGLLGQSIGIKFGIGALGGTYACFRSLSSRNIFVPTFNQSLMMIGLFITISWVNNAFVQIIVKKPAPIKDERTLEDFLKVDNSELENILDEFSKGRISFTNGQAAKLFGTALSERWVKKNVNWQVLFHTILYAGTVSHRDDYTLEEISKLPSLLLDKFPGIEFLKNSDAKLYLELWLKFSIFQCGYHSIQPNPLNEEEVNFWKTYGFNSELVASNIKKREGEFVFDRDAYKKAFLKKTP